MKRTKSRHHEKRRPGAIVCAGSGCSSALHGVAKESNIARTKKRPSRPFGGTYCSGCSRARFKAAARG